MIFLHAKCHLPTSSSSLVVAVRRKFSIIGTGNVRYNVELRLVEYVPRLLHLIGWNIRLSRSYLRDVTCRLSDESDIWFYVLYRTGNKINIYFSSVTTTSLIRIGIGGVAPLIRKIL
jgi:hypothetical protein